MKPKPFRIFRAGTHTDSAGNKTTFTREELLATVNAYNEGEWRAPLVCGHPQGHAPAFGWVGKMRIDDQDEVWVDTLDDLNSDFAELMANKAYRNRSASWYHPEHPNNPTPGTWQLRHLGILGAQPPALKGLGDVEFGDAEGVTVDFADWIWSDVGRLFRGMRDFFIEKFGVEAADRVLPSYTLSDLENRGRQALEDPIPDFSDDDQQEDTDMTLTPAEIAELQAKAARADTLEGEVTTLKTQNTDLQAQVTSFSEQNKVNERATALAQAKTELQPLVASGQILPAQVDHHANFMVGLDNATKAFEFGDFKGDTALTQRGMYLQNLKAGPKIVEYAEITAGAGLPDDLTPDQLSEKITEYRDAEGAKGRVITFAQAMDHVTKSLK